MSVESELKNVSKSVVDIFSSHKTPIPAQIAERNYKLWKKQDLKYIAFATLPKQALKAFSGDIFEKLSKLRSET